MGTDIYHCNIESHAVWTRTEAIRRAVSYGYAPSQPPAVLQTHPGPFLEIALTIRTVYCDAPVAWDELMLLRLVDEAVYHAARYDQSGFDFEKTPIADRYPGFWTMGFKTDRPLTQDLTLVQVEHVRRRARPAPTGTGPATTPRVVFFLPESLAPNLAGWGFWESRAWGGYNYYADQQLRELRPWAVEARQVKATAQIKKFARQPKILTDEIHRPALTPRAAGGLWFVTHLAIFHLDPDTQQQTFVAELPRPQKNLVSTCAVEDRDGRLWVGLNKGLGSYHPDTGPVFEADGHAGKEIHALGLTPDGRVVVAGVGGIWLRGDDGGWTHVREGLLDTTVERMIVDDQGVIWAAGSKGLTRRNADGSLERFQKTQGVGGGPWLAPLPDGAIYVHSYSEGGGYLPRGGSKVEPHPLSALLPQSVYGAALGPDGTLWAASGRGLLVRLRPGDPPRAMDLSAPLGHLWRLRLLPLASGDLWITNDEALIRYSAADQARDDATPPIREQRVSPFSWKVPKKRAVAIDFNGKIVALTGTFSRLSRDEASRLLAGRGATVASGVTAKTNYLIAGKGAGSKADKAAKLGVIVLDEDALLAAPASGAGEDEAPALSDAELAARFPRWSRAAPPPSTLDLPLIRSMCQGTSPMSAPDWAAKLADHQQFLARGGDGGRFENLSVSGLLLAVYVGVDEETSKLQLTLRHGHLPAGLSAAGADLRSANLGACLLEGVNLAGANLREANLVGAFLAGADLSGADLSHADLSSADLRGANLRGAKLYKADFERADLTGADLTGANTHQAGFPYANVEGAKV